MRSEFGGIFSEKNDLFDLLKSNRVCCGLCCSLILDKYAGRQLKNVKSNGSQGLSIKTREHNIYFNSLDIITKGKILERLLNDIKQIDAFDKIDPHKLSRLTSYLRRFFEEKFLIKELKYTYARYLLDSWNSKLKVRLITKKKMNVFLRRKVRLERLRKRKII